ncbi:MAG TPA: hypothetical protein PK280_21110 [Planctomycetota bacterium]|nr:hypothetical protein [Planctomycetota bacterium]
MRHLVATLALTALAAGLFPDSGQARERRKPRPERPSVTVQPGIPDAQEPIEWLTDSEEAFKLAAEGNRALLILISTAELERSGQVCRFAANSVRKAVRDAKVVPLKILPPPALDLNGLKPEEAKQRQEVFAAGAKKYEELAKRYGASSVPSLICAAPDGAKLTLQAGPADDAILASLARLPEMVKAHAEAVAKAGPKPGPAPGAPASPPEVKPPEPKEPPKGGVDDF